jgi:predicted nucleic acid-binding protein
VEFFSLKAYTSALVLEEVTFKLIMQSASNFLKNVTLKNVKAFLSNSKNKEKVFMPVEEYRVYLNTLKDFGLIVLDLTDNDMVAALEKAKTYGLITADASHIAVMERKRITNLASSDSDFKMIDSVTLWMP